MKDLTVVLEDRPGELAKLGRATGAAGINIEGMGGDAREGRGVLPSAVAGSCPASATRRGRRRRSSDTRLSADDGPAAAGWEAGQKARDLQG
jgi:hypothetical protein